MGPNGEATSMVLLDGCDVPVNLLSKQVFMPMDHHCLLYLMSTAKAFAIKCLLQ